MLPIENLGGKTSVDKLELGTSIKNLTIPVSL